MKTWDIELLEQEHAPKGDPKTDLKTALYLVACTRHYMLEEAIFKRNFSVLSMLLSVAGYSGKLDKLSFQKALDLLQELVDEGAIVRMQGGGSFCAPAFHSTSVGKVSSAPIQLRVSFDLFETDELRFVDDSGEYPLFSRFVVIPGDEVEVEINHFIHRAYVVRITKLRTMLIGTCMSNNNIFYRERGFRPFDVRTTRNSVKAGNGDMVVSEIVERKSPNILVARIREVINTGDTLNNFILTAVLDNNIPSSWPDTVKMQAKTVPQEVEKSEHKGRVDLRKLPLVTIDGEDARDFDDAVYCEKEGDKFHLYVAIADVSYYVRSGSAINTEALNRCNSVYFPYFVIPMLPEVLSNGICSLNPKVDRLCMVCEMIINKKGTIEKYQFYPAVMNSHARLTYNEAYYMIQKGKAIKEEHNECVPWVKALYELYLARKQDRVKRGAFEFESPEVSFLFNEKGQVCGMEPEMRNEAHMLIEECMIAANICAASFIVKSKAESLFRVHDRPTPEKLDKLRSILSRYGIDLPGAYEPTPEDFKKVAEQVERLDDGVRQIISLQLLRSMSKAVYSPENIGHFGLALQDYAHFTSPIRRYADLQLHREIKFVLEKSKKQTWGKIGAQNYTFEELVKLGKSCSEREKAAADAEFDVDNSLKCEYVKSFVGETVVGTISTISSMGVFVTLNDFFIDGMITGCNSDPNNNVVYINNDNNPKRVGEQIYVRIMQVDSNTRRITLMPSLNLRKKDKNFDMASERERLAKTAVRDLKVDNSNKDEFFDRLADISRGYECSDEDLVSRASYVFNIDDDLDEAKSRRPAKDKPKTKSSKSTKKTLEATLADDLAANAAAEAAAEGVQSDLFDLVALDAENEVAAPAPKKSAAKSKSKAKAADIEDEVTPRKPLKSPVEPTKAPEKTTKAKSSAKASKSEELDDEILEPKSAKSAAKSTSTKATAQETEESTAKATKSTGKTTKIVKEDSVEIKVTRGRQKKVETPDPLLEDTASRIDADLNHDVKKASTKSKGKAKAAEGEETKSQEAPKKSSKTKSNAKSKQEVIDQKELSEEKQVAINEATTVVVKKRATKAKQVVSESVTEEEPKTAKATAKTKATKSEAKESEDEVASKETTSAKKATKAASSKTASSKAKSTKAEVADESPDPKESVSSRKSASSKAAATKASAEKTPAKASASKASSTKASAEKAPAKALAKASAAKASSAKASAEKAPAKAATKAAASKSSSAKASAEKAPAKAPAKASAVKSSAAKAPAKASASKAASSKAAASKEKASTAKSSTKASSAKTSSSKTSAASKASSAKGSASKSAPSKASAAKSASSAKSSKAAPAKATAKKATKSK